MSGAAGWLKLAIAGASRVAPGPVATLAHTLFRRPAVARRFDNGSRELLKVAQAIIDRGEPMDVETRSGALRAYRFRPATAPLRGTVLLLHGWTADARAMGAFVDPLLAAGYEALIPDLPAHGSSDGDETDAPASARAVMALLAEHGATPDHIIAHSFGGGVAGMLAAEGLRPRSMVAIASPSRFSAITDDFAAAFSLPPAAKTRFENLVGAKVGMPIADLDAHIVWRGADTRILVLHAPDDAEVDFAEGERLAALPTAELKPMPGLGHREIVYHETSVAAALDFIKATGP